MRESVQPDLNRERANAGDVDLRIQRRIAVVIDSNRRRVAKGNRCRGESGRGECQTQSDAAGERSSIDVGHEFGFGF